MNGNSADVDLRRAEAGRVLGDDQVAGERQPERAGQHVAAGGADRRLAELAEQPEDAREPLAAECLARAATSARSPSQVAAAGEDPLVRRGEHHDPDRVVVAGVLERLDQLGEQLVGERVAGLGLVERDRRDAGVGDRRESLS